MTGFSYRQNIIILLGVLLSLQHLYSQTEICELSNSLVDSTYSKEQKAHAVYNWITANMKYDVKAFVENSPNETSVDKIFKSRSGVCYEFALLYKTMCNCLGLETYIIYGYVRDPYYYFGKQFLRGNHAWCAVKLDSTIALVDPTWGSGQLVISPSMGNRISSTILFKPLVASQIKFERNPNENYFDIAPTSLIETHLPLNPAWQLLDFPVTYESFINDTSGYLTTSINYLPNFSDSPLWEAEKGFEFNELNGYDLAHEKTKKASVLLDMVAVNFDSTKIDELEIVKTLSSEAYLQTQVQKSYLDSLFRVRKKDLSNGNKQSGKLNYQIERDAKRHKKLNSRRKIRERMKNISKTRSKAGGYVSKLSRLESTELKGAKKIHISKDDSLRLLQYQDNITLYHNRLDSLLKVTNENLRMYDTLLNFYLANNKKLNGYRDKFFNEMAKAEEIITDKNDLAINLHLLTLKDIYDQSIMQYYRRRDSYYSLMNHFTNSLKTVNSIHGLGKKTINTLKSAEKLDIENDYKPELDAVLQLMETSYLEGIQFIDKTVEFKNKVNNDNIVDKRQMKKIHSNVKRKIDYFTVYYDLQTSQNINEYAVEKQILNSLKSDSRNIERQADRLLKKLGVE